MGSADSKLNFRKAVIQLTTKTQVRPGSRPPHPPAGLGAGAGGGGGGCCANLAREEMGDRLACRVTLKPGPERDPLAYPRASSPNPSPSPPASSPWNIPLPAAAAATLG